MKFIILLAIISLASADHTDGARDRLSTSTDHTPGAWKRMDIKDPKVIELAEKAVILINQRCNCTFYRKFVRIVMAQYQVVNGTNFRVLLELAPTKCPKDKPEPECEIDPKMDHEMCMAMFNIAPGSKDAQMTNYRCWKPVEENSSHVSTHSPES